MTIPQIPQNLGNLVKLREFLDSFRSEIVTSILGGNVKDYGASGDGVTDDTQAILLTMAALAASGGTVYFPPGTYLVTDTLAFGDKDIQFYFTSGAKIITTGLGAKPLFKSLTGLTAMRKAIFWGPTTVGENLATAQYFLELADVNSRCRPEIYSPDITGFRRVFNISGAEVAYTVPVIMRVIGGRILPPHAVSTLLLTPFAAGTYNAGYSVYFTDCRLRDDSNTAFGWVLDFDGDLILSGIFIAINGTSKINGLVCSNTNMQGNTSSLEVLGGSFDSADIITAAFAGVTLKLSNGVATGCLILRSGIIVNAVNASVTGLRQHSSNPATIAVDILAGADRVAVDGTFADCTTAAIRTAAQRTTITGCTFVSTGTNKTILEAGAADRTLVTGCNGISSGGGFTVPGANSLVGADNIG